jgi:site-specific recombinase XerD
MESAKIYRLNKAQSTTNATEPLANTSSPPQKPKLLEQVRQGIRTRHLSPHTEQAYVGWIKRFIFFHNKRHPVEMAEAEIGNFLSSLATDAKVSASTQNQALNALLFLYHEVLDKKIGLIQGVVRAKRPSRLPVVLTKEEVQRLLNSISGTPLVDGDAVVRGRIAAHGVLSP